MAARVIRGRLVTVRESSVAEARLQSVSASSLTVSVHPLEMSASRRPRIRWRESLVCLLWAAVIACQAVGTTIQSVSLNMNGTLYVTNQSQDAVKAIVCRVTHNSTNRTISFRLNDTVLNGFHRLQRDNTIRVTHYEDCHNQPTSPAGVKCDELVLVVRAVPAINNSRFICDARSRDDNSDMGRKDSNETVTIILRDPAPVVTEETEPPACSPSPSPSSHPHPPTITSSHTSPPSTPMYTPAVDEPDTSKNTDTIIPKGRERWYVAALTAETVLLIATIALCLCLLCCVCRKNTKYHFEADLERSASPPALESTDTKGTYRPSTELQHTSDCDNKEPRYATAQCVSNV